LLDEIYENMVASGGVGVDEDEHATASGTS
jgi:hypothetical protein